MKNKKISFVCSGGVAKAAAWHLGVALALDDMGFSFKHNNSDADSPSSLEISSFVGSSAGAMVCLYLTCGYSPQDVINSTLRMENALFPAFTYKDFFTMRRPGKAKLKKELASSFDGFPALIQKMISPITQISGLFSTAGIADYIRNHIIHSENFEDFDADLFIVGTQLDHSRKVIFSKYNYPNPNHDSTAEYYTGISVVDAACASMAVPPFFCPHPIKNPVNDDLEYYIDGEIRETLSTHVAKDNGANYIISSWTHTPYHYHHEVGSLVNYGIPSICLQAIYLMIQKKIVASRAREATSKDIVDSVSTYMISEKFNDKNRKDILTILERKLNYNANVKYIDIFPSHTNYQLFFGNSFSLNPKLLSQIVRTGYKRTFHSLKNYKWD
ncbi:MAG: patatin-like phospholipase family protein [Bacteriovoracaceae bacterium]|nr:patatin-like phospholipase family protein [Bacteriovoracaceae bacterium]